MLKFIYLVVLIFLLNQTLERCQKGCLSCTEEDKCRFCDISTNYKLQNNDCVLVSTNNCTRRLNNGTCY